MKSLGIGQGDEVIVPCLSWIASANAIALTGAKPVFADIEDDPNLSPASVRRLITNKVKAVLAVDFTGRPVQIDKIEEIAKEHEQLLRMPPRHLARLLTQKNVALSDISHASALIL